MTENDMIIAGLDAQQTTAMGRYSPVAGGIEPRLILSTFLGSKTPNTRRAYAGSLRLISGGVPELFPWHQLTYAETAQIRARLVAGYAPVTAKRHLAALRGVLLTAWKLGLMETDTYHRAVALDSVPGDQAPMKGRDIPPEEMEQLFSQCNRGVEGARDAALLACGYYLGLRRSEIAAVQVESIDLRVHTIAVEGKGRKIRVLPLGEAEVHLRRWLGVLGSTTGPLLRPIRQGIIGEPGISSGAIARIANRLVARAGLDPVTPHDFRRSFCTRLLRAGVDLMVVADAMGHADLQTTRRYDLRGLDSMAEAFKKMAEKP